MAILKMKINLGQSTNWKPQKTTTNSDWSDHRHNKKIQNTYI